MDISAGLNDPVVQSLRAEVAGTVQAEVSLARHTTLGVGGLARAVLRAESTEDLQAAARVCRDHGLPWLIIGRGSNLLVADSGWDGLVILLGKGLRGVDVISDQDPQDVRVQVGAAEPMPVLANKLERLGLQGMAFGVAIPGTVGGAVRMNAGAHGAQLADVLVWAQVVRLDSGSAQRITAPELQMSYRHTALPDAAVVTQVEVSLSAGDGPTLAAEMADMRQWRRDHQPINQPSCGSVFRNPEGDSAGRLIDSADLLGYQVGGARISTKHANFITVTPQARAADVYAIIRHAQREVRRVHGIVLHPEVVIAGEFEEGLE
ncbi:MAG: UDP-N-acetylmuramate dehydrogenase [Euzebya sp.]